MASMSMYQTPTNVIDVIRRYFKFSAEEIRALIISTLLIAFIVSFNEWGATTFNALVGLRNLFNAVLIVLLGLLFHISLQRIAGLMLGFKVEYRMWLYGLLAGVAITIVSNGKLWLLLPGGVLFFHMAGHRLGAFRFGMNHFDIAVVGFWGPFANMLLAIFFKWMLVYFPGNPLLAKAMVVNLWLGAFTILPIPPLDGSHGFYGSRLAYFFSIGFIWGLALLLYLPLSPLIVLILGLLIGVITWFCYNWFREIPHWQKSGAW